ncbi:hypothetical protein CEUSTIGMA_g11113.t1 [Chlamydomonas eustigma]|uniref:Uncharacterized protein n=1 Tax=Chlamydomonas eustigma TaxID=1157962 RepID=A0A250XKT4_9CHLO|nr:hypothetical protein CEUSTIGMA_g11113.t1 [Chlamydomonas eustigma]|eukprot:GAX83688.1 hypothetical protein CEUSTIGMA_g11113.t1 [Chlamydomonas eustigma]
MMTSRYDSSGNTSSSTNAKDGNSSASNFDGYAAQLFQEADIDGPMVSRNAFNSLRKETLDEDISEAGSEDEEQIILEHTTVVQQADPAALGGDIGELDELALLLSDTPYKKMKLREKDARKLFQAGDLWASLKCRMDILGIAKMYSTGPYCNENKYPMLLSDAHFKLSKSYAALQCVPQAIDHCNRALEAIPSLGMSNSQVISFKKEVHILLGEALLMASPPKPQASLQYLLASEGCSCSDDLKDPGVRILAAQCHAILGIEKLQQISATRNAEDTLNQRVQQISAKLLTLDGKSKEYERLQQKLEETQNELIEERGFGGVLVNEARLQLDKATDILMFVIDEEEQRLRKKMSDEERKGHPLIQLLWRRACEILFKMSVLEGVAGRIKNQVGHLENITGVQEGYNCISQGLLACVLKEKGAALVALGSTQSDSQLQQAELKKALGAYDDLMDLQAQRFPEGSAKYATSRAEALKLMGNVYVALRQWERAQEHFNEAMDMYASYLGPTSSLVSDLQTRILEVNSYINAPF